jgi:hypothetical protein
MQHRSRPPREQLLKLCRDGVAMGCGTTPASERPAQEDVRSKGRHRGRRDRPGMDARQARGQSECEPRRLIFMDFRSRKFPTGACAAQTEPTMRLFSAREDRWQSHNGSNIRERRALRCATKMPAAPDVRQPKRRPQKFNKQRSRRQGRGCLDSSPLIGAIPVPGTQNCSSYWTTPATPANAIAISPQLCA